MANFLKTLIHLLSIMVICTAMAACSTMDGGSQKFTSYGVMNVSVPTSSILDN